MILNLEVFRFRETRHYADIVQLHLPNWRDVPKSDTFSPSWYSRRKSDAEKARVYDMLEVSSVRMWHDIWHLLVKQINNYNDQNDINSCILIADGSLSYRQDMASSVSPTVSTVCRLLFHSSQLDDDLLFFRGRLRTIRPMGYGSRSGNLFSARRSFCNQEWCGVHGIVLFANIRRRKRRSLVRVNIFYCFFKYSSANNRCLPF